MLDKKTSFTISLFYRCVFVCCGHVIKVLSVASGECVRELCRHRNTVTSIHVNPHNHLQVSKKLEVPAFTILLNPKV